MLMLIMMVKHNPLGELVRAFDAPSCSSVHLHWGQILASSGCRAFAGRARPESASERLRPQAADRRPRTVEHKARLTSSGRAISLAARAAEQREQQSELIELSLLGCARALPKSNRSARIVCSPRLLIYIASLF